MEKAEKILAYLMRVDEQTGKIYKGYFTEVENSLRAEQLYVNYNKPQGLIQVLSIGEIDIICNDEGKLLEYPVNRAWVVDGKAIDVFCGNLMCVRHRDGEFVSILESDKDFIESHLPPVLSVVNNQVIAMDNSILAEYKEG